MGQSVGHRVVGWARTLTSLACVAAIVTGITGCLGAPDGHDVDSDMSMETPATAPSAAPQPTAPAGSQAAPAPQPPSVGCGTPDTGCPCDLPGEIVLCPGPKFQVGDYTTCAPGHRVCGDDGTWGPCIGRTMHFNDGGAD
jgi:hypothetical protein